MALGSIAVALAIAWIFAHAAWHKFRSPLWYAALLQEWGLKTAFSNTAYVRTLGLLEALIAIGLLMPPSRALALWVSAGVFVVYAAFMFRLLLSGASGAACGCAGPDSGIAISYALVARNVVIAVVAMFSSVSMDVVAMSFGQWLVSAAFGFLLAMFYHVVEQLIANAQKLDGVT